MHKYYSILSNSNLHNTKIQYLKNHNNLITMYNSNDSSNLSCKTENSCCINSSPNPLENGSFCCEYTEIFSSKYFNSPVDSQLLATYDQLYNVVFFKNTSNDNCYKKNVTLYPCKLYTDVENIYQNDYYIIGPNANYDNLYDKWVQFCPAIDNGTSYSCNYSDINKYFNR